mgnify:FL=1
MALHLADKFTLPLETVTESLAILARKRAGKSHTAKRLVEQLHKAHQQVVIIDPKGDWWGIRSSADGKGPGLPIIILGGEHGDVPLEAGSGELVARMIVHDRASALLDLARFRKHEVATFMTAFLEALYRLKGQEQYRTPMMLVIDEADAIAPQRPMRGEERMLGAAEDIVRRGGQRGVGVVLVSQRAAVLNKNVLTQASILVTLCTTGSQDLDALDEWIKKHGEPEKRAQLMAAIAKLPRGTAWFWAPGWPDENGIFRQVRILPIETFDSGATPKPGERRVMPKTVADVDLEAFRKEMAATLEKAKAADPKELRARIHQLEAENRKLNATPAPKIQVKIEKRAIIAEATIKRLEAFYEKLTAAGRILLEEGQQMRKAILEAKALGNSLAPPSTTTQKSIAREIVQARYERMAGTLPPGERTILTVIAQHPNGVTREQLSVLTAYKRSSRDTYLQKLRAAGLVDSDGERIIATIAGAAMLGAGFEPLPTGAQLRDYWLHHLPEGERKVLAIILDAYPQAIAREDIDDQAGYKRSSRDTYLQKLRARELIIADRHEVQASGMLFA